MADTFTYLGSLSTGAICPALNLALASALPRIQADIAGAVAAIAHLNAAPPSIHASATLAANLSASIAAAIALGVEVPSLSVQISALAALKLALEIELGALGFNLTAAGVHAFAYDGTATGLGPSLPSAMPDGAPGDHVNALVLATSVPSSWIALGAILKTSA